MQTHTSMLRGSTWLALLALGASLIAPVASAANISGTYVGSGPSIALLLQIVQTSHTQFTGRFEQASLNTKTARVDIMNASVTGAVSGSTIILSIVPQGNQSNAIPASGELTGNTITITGGDSDTFTMHLDRSDIDTFNMALAKINSEARLVLGIHTYAVQLTNLKSTIKHLETFNKYASQEGGRIASYNNSYKKVTSIMRKYLDRELAAFNQLQRDQLENIVFQGFVRSSNMHTQMWVDEYHAGYSNGKLTSPLDGQIDEAIAFCRAWPSLSNCGPFNAALSQYRTSITQLGSDFNDSESIWNQQRAIQSEILSEADKRQYK